MSTEPSDHRNSSMIWIVIIILAVIVLVLAGLGRRQMAGLRTGPTLANTPVPSRAGGPACRAVFPSPH